MAPPNFRPSYYPASNSSAAQQQQQQQQQMAQPGYPVYAPSPYMPQSAPYVLATPPATAYGYGYPMAYMQPPMHMMQQQQQQQLLLQQQLQMLQAIQQQQQQLMQQPSRRSPAGSTSAAAAAAAQGQGAAAGKLQERESSSGTSASASSGLSTASSTPAGSAAGDKPSAPATSKDPASGPDGENDDAESEASNAGSTSNTASNSNSDVTAAPSTIVPTSSGQGILGPAGQVPHRGALFALWVGNLPEDVSTNDMVTLFDGHDYASIFVRHRYKCAFVNFVTEDAAKRAIEAVNGREYCGKNLIVRFRRDPVETATLRSARFAALMSAMVAGSNGGSPVPPYPMLGAMPYNANFVGGSTTSPAGQPQRAASSPGPAYGAVPVVNNGSRAASAPAAYGAYPVIAPTAVTAGSNPTAPAAPTGAQSHRYSRTYLPSPAPASLPYAPSAPIASFAYAPAGLGAEAASTAYAVRATPAQRGGSRIAPVASSQHEPRTRYFLMRAASLDDVQQSTATGKWTTAAQNLNSAYRNGDAVILIFAVHQDNTFYGYGRMASEAVPVLSVQKLPFDNARHLRNSSNGNKEVKVGRDGQEIDGPVGAQLLALFHASNERYSSDGGPNAPVQDDPRRLSLDSSNEGSSEVLNETNPYAHPNMSSGYAYYYPNNGVSTDVAYDGNPARVYMSQGPVWVPPASSQFDYYGTEAANAISSLSLQRDGTHTDAA